MKLVFISDTHNCQNEIDVPVGDVLVHCGDATIQGTIPEVSAFADWFASQPHKHKIFVPGNHDFLFQKQHGLAGDILGQYGIILLCDWGCEIEGVRFYGSPWQPEFFDWAFNLPRGEPLKRIWAMIPDDTDVLITHGPPHGILDEVNGGLNQGCRDLLDRVKQVTPQFHAFGHIHEGYGQIELYGTHFINASICDPAYRPLRSPIVAEIERPAIP